MSDRKVTLLLKDAVWLLDLAPSFATCSDKPTLLRICAAIEKEYSIEQQDIKDHGEIHSWPKSEYDVAIKFRLEPMLQVPSYNKVGAIKTVREVTGLGLKDAKDLVEQGAWTTAYMPNSMVWTTFVNQFKAYGYEVIDA